MRLELLTLDRLRYDLARVGRWYRTTKEGDRIPAAPPELVVRDMLAHPDPPLPTLVQLVQAPFFSPGGRLVVQPGYHAASGTYYTPGPGLEISPVPAAPAELDVAHARAAYALKQIIDAGVRVFFFLEDRERTLDSALEKMMLSLTSFAAEVEREKARQRTYDAMVRKARAGHVTGGRVYGYDNVPVLASTVDADGRHRRERVDRTVNPEQAVVVRRIFTLCAQGLGLTRIAKALNADGVAPPRKAASGWAPTAVREILHRPLYRGELVWNKLQKVDRGGTKKRRRRPAGEWLRLEVPAWRIVPDELWEAAHRRIGQAQSNFGQVNGRGRPTRLDLESPYLLSGLGRCSECGGALIALTRGHGRTRVGFYGCSYHHKRGATICGNAVQIRQDVLDRAVLDAVAEVLDERLLEAAVERALARLRTEHGNEGDRRAALEREFTLIQVREQHLVDAIARGEGVDPLVARLKAEGERKKVVQQELATLDGLGRVTSLEERRLKHDLRVRARGVRQALGKHTARHGRCSSSCSSTGWSSRRSWKAPGEVTGSAGKGPLDGY